MNHGMGHLVRRYLGTVHRIKTKTADNEVFST
jgi:hypothetical protein